MRPRYAPYASAPTSKPCRPRKVENIKTDYPVFLGLILQAKKQALKKHYVTDS